MILDLFAGPGGWDQGLSELGYTDVLGIDFDPSACKTAELAGHKRIVADIANISFSDTGLFSIDGLIASPPCQGLSSGGRKNGWQDREKLIDAILNDNAHEYKDDKSVFLLEPKRWIQESDPKWIVLENVYAVLPVYQAYKEWLEKLGFFVTVNDLQTEAFGVPQTRRRIILVATKDRSV